MKQTLAIVLGSALIGMGCNQPFEPDAPVSTKLVVYSILNSRSDTQYVRLSTTFEAPPSPDSVAATVTVTGAGHVIAFSDTTVLWQDAQGRLAPTHVYVAYNAPMTGGAQYQLQVSTPSGLAASANTTALTQPTLSLAPGTVPGYIVVRRQFYSSSGAAVLRFYVDYYVLLNNGWVLQTEEVPSRTYTDNSGNDAYLYPTFGSVATLISGGTDVKIDSTLLLNTQSRVHAKYAPAPVVDLDLRFTLTQIDEFLYQYYYLPNGPVDMSTIRLDVPDFTNIRGGYGVFGSRAQAILLLPLTR